MVTTTSITVLGARTLPGGPPSGCLCLLALPQGNRSELSYQKALFAIYRMFEGKLSVRITWAGGSLTFFLFFYKEPFSQMKSPREPQFVRQGKVQLFCLKGRRVATKPTLQPPPHPPQPRWLLRPPHGSQETSQLLRILAYHSYKATPSTYR